MEVICCDLQDNYGTSDNPGQQLDVISFDQDYTCLAGYVEKSEKNHNARARELANNALETSVCAEKAKEWNLSQIGWTDKAIEDAQKQGAERWIGSIEAAVRTYEIATRYFTKTGEGSRRSDMQKHLNIARQLLAEAKDKQ